MSQAIPPKLSWLIRRYNLDGSPELSFGSNLNGSIVLSFDVSLPSFDGVPGAKMLGDDVPTTLVPLVDGGLIIAGVSRACATGSGSSNFCESALISARLQPDGTLDHDFGSNGRIVGPVMYFKGDAVAMQSDGTFLVYSSSDGFILGGPPTPTLRRFNLDGLPDSGFRAAIRCVGRGPLRLSQDGEIVIVTALARFPSDYGFCIERLNTDGTPDTEFGAQGVTFVGAGALGRLADFFVDASGRVVVAGSTNSAPVVFRLTVGGSLDTAFGSGGLVAIDSLQVLTSIASDCHGRTLAAGHPSDGQRYFLIRRVLDSGAIDPVFAASPPVSVPTDVLSDDVEGMITRPDGRIVVTTVLAFPAPSVDNALDIVQYQGDLPCGSTTAVEYYHADWNYDFETAFPDEIAALDAGAFGGAWRRTGETFNVWPHPNAAAWPTCRVFSTTFAPRSSHFYTPFPGECAAVRANSGWQFEAVAFYVQIPIGYGTGAGFCPQGTHALYRAYNNGLGGAPNHRYTTDSAVLDAMIAQGWIMEGEASTRVFACVPTQ